MQEDQLEEKILASLNRKQRQAVTSPCSGVLQIVAGPGTGKTKVIVSRVAYLLLHEKISPQNIIVTTFTKKAANEMMERLRDIFAGTEIAVGKLLMGTFHSICYKIIQKYGRLIGLEGVSIADEKDSSQILMTVLTSRITDEQWSYFDTLPPDQTLLFRSKYETSGKFRGFDDKKFKRQISKTKSSGLFPDDYDNQRQKNLILSTVYRAYQEELQKNKILDFDDCLLYCYKIISGFPVLKGIEHTLVDEFQDTNEIQLQLMYHFAKGDPSDIMSQSNVTVVGDPDQSIYAFRDAQSVNFEKMRQHYSKVHSKTCEVITLDENYRSTADILNISETLMRQQSDRVVKNLTSQFDKSFKPLEAVLESGEEEARWITHQIEFLMGLPQGIFSYSDMAILVRSAFQTRMIENEFTKRKIPYFMVRGKAFWDRKEVVAILDYLRCVANENDKLAFLRCVNFPKRGLGPKTMADLETLIDSERVKNPIQSVYGTLKRIATAELKSSLGPKMRTNLLSFLRIIEDTCQILHEQFDPSFTNENKAIENAFKTLYKSAGIREEFEENVDCDLNIGEVEAQLLAFELPPEVSLPDFPGHESPPEEEITGPVYIRKFLESISLYDTDPGKGEDQESKPRVSISTIHGSKGLEWPVVFVPGVSEGLLPAWFAINESIPETVNEERRCLYVATSRAKNLLYISAYEELSGGGWRRPIEKSSRFMDKARTQCASSLELNTPQNLQMLYDLRGSTFADLTFDLKTYYKNYTKRLRSYVKRGKYEDPVPKGFTSAGNLKKQTPNEALEKKTTKYTSNLNSLSSLSMTERNIDVKKAPSYIPVRVKKTTTIKTKMPLDQSSNIDASTPVILIPDEPAPSGIKRAPTYIPSRPGRGKKRLGTR
ncbi:hypothetical protein JCM33374_g5959 [Metschnikowia sp. JCM 33374]|nr:hypothetical protein JCM33374_g5959 [Metschnikowia sp. JCM 33374]